MPKRVLVLVHPDFIPPASIEGLSDEEMAPFKTEFDVVATLRDELGYEVEVIGVAEDLGAIQRTAERFQPHVAFNLLEEFAGVGVYDAHVVSYLESLRLPYTGSNPRGLMLCHDKALAKMLCRYHRIAVPRFAVFPIGRRMRRPKHLSFPLIVKSLTEDGSIGISQKSVVRDDAQLAERVAFIHRQLKTDALVERYIEGREIYVGVIGNERLQTLPLWELHLPGLPEGAPNIATERVKWDEKYQKRVGVETRAIDDLPDDTVNRIVHVCKRAYRALQLSGYARLDFRLTPEGKPFLIEANPNPQLAYGEDFAESADHAGLPYDRLLRKIISLGEGYRLRGRV